MVGFQKPGSHFPESVLVIVMCGLTGIPRFEIGGSTKSGPNYPVHSMY
jgi:hypothetical protein